MGLLLLRTREQRTWQWLTLLLLLMMGPPLQIRSHLPGLQTELIYVLTGLC